MTIDAYFAPRSSRRQALWEASPAVITKRTRLLPWQLAYRAWPHGTQDPLPGYTLLLPVPGDLPVFAWLAIANALAQDAEHRVETLVIPDRPSPAVRDLVESCRAEFGAHALRLVDVPALAPRLQRVAGGGPSNNHWMQFYAGVAAMRSTHALLHDADLFITDREFMSRHYRHCTDRDLSCLGVAQAWDPWMAANHLGHVASTWEMMFTAEWARAFPPWQHKQHRAWLAGEWHQCDTCLATQAHTPPDRCAVNQHDGGLVHFNRVISVYREFQAGVVPQLEDHRFVLLLIRLLIDAVPAKSNGTRVDVPALDELVAGLRDGSRRVTYRSVRAALQFPEFHAKLCRLTDSPMFDEGAAERVHEGVAPFVAALG